jgi:uncharacterized cupin superfamily protein
MAEEPPIVGSPPYQPTAAPPVSGAHALCDRKLHPDDLPWEEWKSRKGKFRGASKELSIALAQTATSPRVSGGHPFDLELSKLAPGETGCPFSPPTPRSGRCFSSSRAEARVRAGDETHLFRAGDVVLHPPGEAHQIINAGERDLVFYLIADNPPVDYWEYPDSKNGGCGRNENSSAPPTSIDWDGEE